MFHNDYDGALADPDDGYDEAIADIATTVAAEVSLEWGLDWADDADLATTWVKIAQYARWTASRNLGAMLARGQLDDQQWQHIADQTGLDVPTLKTNYPPEQGL
jgi:hypothetical protein